MAHDLISLITVLEEDRVLDDRKKFLLLEKVTSLKNLLEKSVPQHHHLRDEIINTLQSEIRDAAHEAEDIIESHAVDQMLLSEPDASIDHSISIVMEKFDAANDKLTKIIKEDYHHQSRHDEEDVRQLKYRLTSQTSAREIIPIVGMGGIGKTTLARNLYNDPLIVSHFDVRAWATVSQDYSMQAILSGLLGNISDNISSQDLGDKLHKRLCGRRYLVVLDDIWSKTAWDEIQRYFPKEGNRSRILITSRELHVAKHPDPECEEHQMHLLSDAQGWDLLRQMVFGKKEHCPHILEEIGKRIASSCGGLPLSISVIGGLLSVDKYSKDLWLQVAKDVRPTVSNTDDHSSKILCLSYDNLPLHLKPCFLYMSAFPEDFEVPCSRLVKLLVAEGFLWRSNSKSLEDVAEEYLKSLVDRNLLSVTRTKYDGRAKSYNMHDLLRDLCVRKAHEEKFLRIIGKYDNVNNFRRVSVHHGFNEDERDLDHGFNEDERDLAEDLSCSRSLLCSSFNSSTGISLMLSTLRLVRVLDVYNIHFNDFPVGILKLANLRFLGVWFKGSLPSELWRLRSLQTLLVRMDGSEVVILPYEAWEISGLRHIIFKRITTICIDFKIPGVHQNLQTISGVRLHDLLASNLINNIPNVKELGVDSPYGFIWEDRIIVLSHLHKLETLRLDGFSAGVLSLVKLPNCLKKLSLIWCTLPMGLVNDLQYLQVLNIQGCEFVEEEGEVWELNEGDEFSSLQFLKMKNLRIKRWKADYSHFPRLRNLKIVGCIYLEELPACIGEMSTLEMIEVSKRNPSRLAWANEVRETQRDVNGNENLQIRINEKHSIMEDLFSFF